MNSAERSRTVHQKEDISQQSLFVNIQDIIKKINELSKKCKNNNSPKFEVINIDDERPKFLVQWGKNCTFEVDKSVLEKLKNDELEDVKIENGTTVSREKIMNYLKNYVDMANKNIQNILKDI